MIYYPCYLLLVILTWTLMAFTIQSMIVSEPMMNVVYAMDLDLKY